MKYVPALMSMDGELNALSDQSFSNNIMPLIRIVKDIKVKNGKASIIDDIEDIIKAKSDIDFFVTIPMNLNLSSKKLKKPVEAFYKRIKTKSNIHRDILIRFAKYSNVIPVIEVNLDSYSEGDLSNLKSGISSVSGKFAYLIEGKNLGTIETELFGLITKNDFLIYNLNEHSFIKTSIKNEMKNIRDYKSKIGFKSIAIKQIYSDLTFSKFPDREILKTDDAYDCIDFDFYDDFKGDFDYFGDMAGIRNNPIYDGGVSYPAYLTIEMDTFKHHGFKGIEVDINSFESTLLPKYLESDHWTKKLTPSHKSACNGCKIINNFANGVGKVNNATKWKTITISHFIDTMDYKISNSIV